MSNCSGYVTRIGRTIGVIAATLLVVAFGRNCRAESTIDHAVMLSAQIQKSPPKITITWAAGANATGYSVAKKAAGSGSWTNLGSTGGTSFADTGVSVGAAYEYRVIKSTNAGYTGYGYIYAGIDAPLVEDRGKIVLLVDSSIAGGVSSELNRLQQDLVGDGWTVLRHDVSRTASVPSIKNIIKSDYGSGNVKAVFLFGHVPVPYSGGTAWDGHIPDHQGAWSADTYYGDMDGNWTDGSVNLGSGQTFSENRNVPGDGKFDQSTIPSDLELSVGRVDMYNLPVFSGKSETDLLKNYLNKDHNYRVKQYTLSERSMTTDNFGTFGGEAFAASGFMDGGALFGSSAQINADNYMPTLNSQSYLFSYGTGPGWVDSCAGVGISGDFATKNPQTAFTAYFGSWFGDFDKQNNFLRSVLGSGYTLTTCWSGRPYWYFHQMTMGETVGYCGRISQNNSGTYYTNSMGTRGTHMALLGDPTLRLHAVTPPSNVSVNGSGTVSWSGSSDSIVGYHVYRSTSASGPFARITSSMVSGTSFTDPNASSGSYVYMVRAIKLQNTSAGTYYNPSVGAFSGGSSTPPPPPPPPSGGNGNGLLGSYYSNTGLSGTAATRVDSTVNFDWGNNAPMAGVSADNFSVRWTGEVQPQYSETYTFYTTGDDGVRLWVNGVQLVNNWVDQSPTEKSGTIQLTANQRYSIQMEQYDHTGGAMAKLSWSSASTPKAIIPQSQLYAASAPANGGSGDGLFGQYYSNSTTLAGTPSTRIDSTVNFAWGTGAAMSGVSADNFSVRWTGLVQAQYSETYTFYATGDDGVRLWVNNVALVDKWMDQNATEYSATITLTANQKYDIRMEYYDRSGGATAKLAWSSPSTPKNIIPQSQLYSNQSGGSGDGLLGTYYSGYFTGTSVQVVDKTVNYDWGTGAPISGIQADGFTVRWTGQVQAQYSEKYTFYTTSDDGVRLWVNNTLIVDKWMDQGATEYFATIDLAAGQKYNIRMDYYDNTGGATAKLAWSSASTPKQIVPQACLFSNTTGVASRSLTAANSDSSDSDSTDTTGTTTPAAPVKPPAPPTEEF
jgi:hypothetical protein